MPGTVKVKVVKARNLPVMDRSTYLTDAFVEIRLGSVNYKTEVCRHSLNPVWNTDWYKFEMDDLELQEQPLQIRVLDHDTYSSHDAIGRVYFDLNPLLGKDQTRSINAWFPIYDTMHGIRGEINLTIRVEIFSDASRFRQSSVGVRFFYSTCVPAGYSLTSVAGVVAELGVNMDPEHQWFERLRSSRASNEARQRLFVQLSGEIQRKLGVKVLELGCNCVLGYQLSFDLEGETGVVARGIGTAAHIVKSGSVILTNSSRPQNSWGSLELENNDPFGSRNNVPIGEDKIPDTPGGMAQNMNLPEISHVFDQLDTAEFPFLTLTYLPASFIAHFGSIVSSKSVKLIESGDTSQREAWWRELRNEIRSHMKSLDCNCVLAYREECTIYEDVVILSAHGTAVVFNSQFHSHSDSSHSEMKDGCSPAHVAYRNVTVAGYSNVRLNNCHVCKRSWVPDVIFSSTELPPEMAHMVIGKPALIQVRTSRTKKEFKGEACAKELSNILPFIEFELHRRLMYNVKLKCMNSLFGLHIRLSIGRNLIIVIASGTALYLKPLPAPQLPKLNVSENGLSVESLNILQNQIKEHIKRCKRTYHLKNAKNITLDSSLDHTTTSIQNNFVEYRRCQSEVKKDHLDTEAVNLRVVGFQDNASNRMGSIIDTIVIPREEIDIPELMRILDEDKVLIKDMNLLSLSCPPFPFSKEPTTPNPQDPTAPQCIHHLTRFLRLQLSQDWLDDGSPSVSPIVSQASQINAFSTGASDGNFIDLPLAHSGQMSTTSQIDVQMQQLMAMELRSLLFSCRLLRPCVILGLDCKVFINEDNQLQILLSGLCVSTPDSEFTAMHQHCLLLPWMVSSEVRKSDFKTVKALTMQRSSSPVPPRSLDEIAENQPYYQQTSHEKGSAKEKMPIFSRVSSGELVNSRLSLIMETQETRDFIISPLFYVPFYIVKHYLGNLDFFFVRESTSVREYGGVSGFVQACIAEVQTVVRAHAIALGGNGLLSFHFSESQMLSSTSRNQAQCLLNVCADIVCLAPLAGSKRTTLD